MKTLEVRLIRYFFLWRLNRLFALSFNRTKKQEPRTKTKHRDDLGSCFLKRSGLGSIKRISLLSGPQGPDMYYQRPHNHMILHLS